MLFSSGKSGWFWKQQVVGWLWQEPVIVINLDLLYKHEAVSEKVSESYNSGLLWQLESVLSSNNLNRQELRWSKSDFFCILLGSAVNFSGKVGKFIVG